MRYPGYPRNSTTAVTNILELLVASEQDENKFDEFVECFSIIFDVENKDIRSEELKKLFNRNTLTDYHFLSFLSVLDEFRISLRKEDLDGRYCDYQESGLWNRITFGECLSNKPDFTKTILKPDELLRGLDMPIRLQKSVFWFINLTNKILFLGESDLKKLLQLIKRYFFDAQVYS